MKAIMNVRGQEAMDVAGLLKGVATQEGLLPFHEIHKETLNAVVEHLFKSDFGLEDLNTSFDGAAEKISNPELRRDIMNMAGIFPFLEEENKEERISSFGHLATKLGFDKRFAKQLHKLCHDKVLSMALDQFRGLSLEMGGSMWKSMLKMAAGFFHLDGNKEMLAEYQRYQTLPDHIFGKVLTDYYRDNHFALPGTAGEPMSNTIRIHDIHHVLSGYPTTPLGEICVIAFDGALMEEDLGKALIGYVAQFQVGLQFDKGIPRWKNQFKPDLVLRAFERGGECNVNYLQLDFDFTELLEEPLAAVRERFNISPEGMLVRGPEDLWCGDLGVVGTRDNEDQIKKEAFLQRLIQHKFTTD